MNEGVSRRDIDHNAHGEGNHDHDTLKDVCCMKEQSIELRKGLEDLMEHIQSHRHEESSESFEERYLLLLSSYPPGCLSIAVTLTDDDIGSVSSSSKEQKEVTLRLPIHLACDKNAPPLIVKSLLDADYENKNENKNKNNHHKDKCQYIPSFLRADKWGDLPIHIACSRAAAVLSASDLDLYGLRDVLDDNVRIDRIVNRQFDGTEVVRLLLEADKDKETLSVKDVHGALPLHTAVRYNAPLEVVFMLLNGAGRNQQQDQEQQQAEGTSKMSVKSSAKANANAACGLYTEGIHGQLPLHIACRSGDPRPDVLKLLLIHDDLCSESFLSHNDQPSTALHKDTTGRLPIHVLMLRNKCYKCLRVLLEGMLGTSRRTKLNVGNHKYHSYINRNSILSVGLDAWKHSWLREMIPALDGSNFYERDFTTRDKLDVICAEAKKFYETCIALELATWKMSCETASIEGEKRDAEEERIFKRNRRIVSGAEIIVPNVLSFLEDQPVEGVLEIFCSYGYLGKNSRLD